jgi:hypothetical protein
VFLHIRRSDIRQCSGCGHDFAYEQENACVLERCLDLGFFLKKIENGSNWVIQQVTQLVIPFSLPRLAFLQVQLFRRTLKIKWENILIWFVRLTNLLQFLSFYNLARSFEPPKYMKTRSSLTLLFCVSVLINAFVYRLMGGHLSLWEVTFINFSSNDKLGGYSSR